MDTTVVARAVHDGPVSLPAGTPPSGSRAVADATGDSWPSAAGRGLGGLPPAARRLPARGPVQPPGSFPGRLSAPGRR